MAAMTASGAAIGLIGGPIGAAIGSAIGAATGGLMGASVNIEANKEENERIDKLTKLYDDIGEAAFDQNELIDLGFDTASKKYIESVKKIVKANVEAAE
jgi:phage tail tape-measure protein